MTPEQISHIINELGEDRARYYNAAAAPIMQTSIFTFPTTEELAEGLSHSFERNVYSRGQNPTNQILQKKLAALEGTEECLLFSSGVAAISAAVLNEVGAGDHMVMVDKAYGPARALAGKYLARFGVECSLADGKDPEAIAAAFRPNTKVLYLETPSSMVLELQDLTACAELARRHGVVTICDNTYATPLYQRPAEHGIDVVVHSASKYLGGHSDLVGGVVCTDGERARRIFAGEYLTLGGVMPPFHAWLILRSLRTLPLRMERHAATALRLAQWLETHPRVLAVHHPFLPSHPQYELARRQMQSGTGLFSFELDAPDREAIFSFCDHLKCFHRAISWGGYESLVCPTAASYNRQAQPSPYPWNLIRLHAGLEDPDLLQADLEAALAMVPATAATA
ncbi:aminotransferase class I/II-fold pyridoxal phosphate-dependent enzyme [bacterium]|nr:aminotransferase class I/II-fold pyridoxal phosphate-dependent enzyme [bacterium]